MLPDPSEGYALLQIIAWTLARGVLGSGEQIERQLYARHLDLVPILQGLFSHNVRAVDEQRLRTLRWADGVAVASSGDRCRRFGGKPAGQPNGRSVLRPNDIHLFGEWVFQSIGFPGNNQGLGGGRRFAWCTVHSSEHHGSIQIDRGGRRRRTGRHMLLEDEPVLADGDHVRVMKLAARDRLAIDGGAVAALQVFEKVDGLNLDDSRMMARNGGIFDRKGIVALPTDRQGLMGQFDMSRAFPVKLDEQCGWLNQSLRHDVPSCARLL